MTGDDLLPPIDPNQLGTGRCYFIDDLLVPYIIPRLYLLTSTQIYEGDYEDIVGTHYAFNELLTRLTGKRSCMVGQVVLYFTNDPPPNSIICDGEAYFADDFPELWAVIHDSLKISATQFRVPDLRRRSPVGYESGFGVVGAKQGANTFTLLEQHIPEHTHAGIAHDHALTDPGHTHTNTEHTHTVTDPGHFHDISHTHTMFARDNGLVPGNTSRMAKADASGTNSTPSTQTQSTNNSGTKVTGISNVPATITIAESETGIDITSATAEVETWGGLAGVTTPIDIKPLVTVGQYAIIYR